MNPYVIRTHNLNFKLGLYLSVHSFHKKLSTFLHLSFGDIGFCTSFSIHILHLATWPAASPAGVTLWGHKRYIWKHLLPSNGHCHDAAFIPQTVAITPSDRLLLYRLPWLLASYWCCARCASYFRCCILSFVTYCLTVPGPCLVPGPCHLLGASLSCQPWQAQHEYVQSADQRRSHVLVLWRLCCKNG